MLIGTAELLGDDAHRYSLHGKVRAMDMPENVERDRRRKFRCLARPRCTSTPRSETDRTAESLGAGDIGVVMMRKRFLGDLDSIEQGRDPKGDPERNVRIELPCIAPRGIDAGSPKSRDGKASQHGTVSTRLLSACWRARRR
jgi:hypothetical protein